MEAETPDLILSETNEKLEKYTKQFLDTGHLVVQEIYVWEIIHKQFELQIAPAHCLIPQSSMQRGNSET